MDFPQARDLLAARLRDRKSNFLAVLRNLVFDNGNSPYRRLLRWAGYDYARLEQRVAGSGVEATLKCLRDAGVFISVDEFKGKRPILRPGLTIEARASDFDNPGFMGRGLAGRSSGTRSGGTRVLYDWHGLAEEAANECVLHEIHGVAAAPLALWLPAPPGVAGFRNLLMNLKFGRPPEHWFSHLRNDRVGPSLTHRMAFRYLCWTCAGMGIRAPAPEFTTLYEAARVARWLAAGDVADGRRVLRTFTSSAVRVAQAALVEGLPVAGHLVFTGGEPLTEARSEFIRSAGLEPVARYSAAETGVIAGSCDRRSSCDDMHLYTDRFAVVTRQSVADPEDPELKALLFTGLSVNHGKVLLNTELGDLGRVEERPCGCVFGQLGMETRLSRVGSREKFTVEGVSLLGSHLDRIVWTLVAAAGGSPNDYQFREVADSRGITSLWISVDPRVPIEVDGFRRAVMDGLAADGPAGPLTAQLWEQGGTLQVVRERPEVTPGFKMVPVRRESPRRHDAAGR
ncbi:MAG: hypothetical protein P1P84_02065 [Deferrisomatales bacterium]|nr:hypothetical protein [Deferrisomatales bacterium]